MIDIEMIFQKFIDGEKYLDFLDNKLPENFRDFEESIEVQLIGERIFEIISQIIIDVCLHISSNQGRVPETYSDCIGKLVDLGILEPEQRITYKKIVGLRNILAHQYGKIDLELLYFALLTIKDDYKLFMNSVNLWLKDNIEPTNNTS